MSSAQIKMFIKCSRILLRCQFHRTIGRTSYNLNYFNLSYISTNRISNKLQNFRSLSTDTANVKDREKISQEVFATDTAEKIFSQIIHDRKSKYRIHVNDLKKLMEKIEENKYVSSYEALVMIDCCSSLLPDVPSHKRLMLLDNIWQLAKKFCTVNIDHYNKLLQCYIDNKHHVVARKFIEDMDPLKPNDITYRLLLAAACEVGDMNQAMEILSNMKSSRISLTIDIFNSLIEGNGKSGNFVKIEEVLEMMKSLKISKTTGTFVALIKVSIWNNRIEDIKTHLSFAKSKAVLFTDKEVMDIIKCLVYNKLDYFIDDVLKLLHLPAMRVTEIPPYLNTICIQLVYEGYPEAAYKIYKLLCPLNVGPLEDPALHCKKFIRECIKASTPLEVIQQIAVDLMESKQNMYALEVSCEAALYYCKVDFAKDIIKFMKSYGSPIRCHYFWPLFKQASTIDGEKGIFEILSLMKSLEIVPDFDTYKEYILPCVNIASPESLILKLKIHGISISSSLNPVVFMLLKNGKLHQASELCGKFLNNLKCEILMPPLIKGFRQTMDHASLIKILHLFNQKPADNMTDWIGMFLTLLISKHNWKGFGRDLESILKNIRESGIKLSTPAVEMCIQNIETIIADRREIERYKNLLYSMEQKSKINESHLFHQHIPHPRDMNLEQLEAHLIELESKNMNCRGVLRKLLQEYCRRGNILAAKNVIGKCDIYNVQLSAGMLANVMYMYVKSDDLQNAEKYFLTLSKLAPNFVIDEFKILDYANLLLKNRNTERAMAVLENYAGKCNVKGGKALEGNCRRLLNTISNSGSLKEMEKITTHLLRLGFCEPTNNIFAPIIRLQLNSSDETGAVERFTSLANKYKKTPLKHELLCHLLMLSNNIANSDDEKKVDVSENYQNLLTQVIEVDRKLHGSGNSQVSLIIALADMDLKKPLRRYVLDPTVNIHHSNLMKQCIKLGEENKHSALELIAECMEGIRNIFVEDIYEIIIKIHSITGDCNAALKLWNKMTENEVKPSKIFVEVFSGLLKSHKETIPLSLYVHMDEKLKISISEN